jgi:multidrug efflux pump subunit AcrB
LIIEFAKDQREQGTAVAEAAVLVARMRFCAVMMTSFAFILGVYPLLVATGAAEISRYGVGTPRQRSRSFSDALRRFSKPA